MTEEWKPISGYEGFYEVSNLGNVRSVDRYVRSGNGNLRKIPSRPVAQVVTHGYKVVCLSRNNKQKCIRVHKIVCSEFNRAGAPDEVVNHTDGDKMNNRADNLEWVTHQENVVHAVETGLFGERAKKATPEVVAAIRAEYIPYDRKHSTIALGRKYGIDPAYVWRIINGQKRKRPP